MSDTIFTAKDKGCWINGAYGEEHRRAKLVDMVLMVVNAINHPGELQTGNEIITELNAEPSDDLGEEDDAKSYLQDYTQEGLYWTWDAGDLILTDETEE